MRWLAFLAIALMLLAGCGGRIPEPSATTTQAVTTSTTSAEKGALKVAATRNATEIQGVAFDVQHTGDEPSLGIDSKGRLFVGVGFADQSGYRTDVLRSDDGGTSWSDVSPQVAGQRTHPTTGDPVFFLDAGTDRLFLLDMVPLVCNYLSTSDDGGATWTPPTAACPLPATDHPTIGAATPALLPPNPSYPNMVGVCYNQVAATECGRSLDGGLTFTPAGPPFSLVQGASRTGGSTVNCGALTGRLKGAADGTLYLPNGYCDLPAVAVSRDGMTTWDVHTVGNDPPANVDPSIAIGLDGTAYMAYITQSGRLAVSASRDSGDSWEEPFSPMGPGITAANLPAAVAGNGGRMAVFYYGSKAPGGYGLMRSPGDQVTWDAYLALVENATTDHPTVQTVRLNPMGDPVFRGVCGPGRCPPILDFVDAQVDPDGRPWAAYVDACTAACASATGKASDSTWNEAFVGTVASGRSLLNGAPLPAIHHAKA